MSRRLSVLISALITIAALPAGVARPQAPPEPESVDIDLPSDATGVTGGTLAVRLYPPDQPRYDDGAPVLIFAQGGDSTGGLNAVLPLAEGVIRVVFVYPGGRDTRTGRASDGVYDNRGPNCIAALRDVIRYAAGELADDRGRFIDQVVGVAVLHDNIGLFGSSNGGNIVVAAPALYGTSLAGKLRYVIQWESPVSSQVATVDMGPGRLGCPGSQAGTTGSVNPWYDPSGFTDTELAVDYSRLAYDPNDTDRPVFFDGTGDGRFTTVANPQGCQTPDLNGDGSITSNEDFPLGAYVDGQRRVYSRPATRAMQQNGLFATWPDEIDDLAQAEAFWDLREAVRLYDEAAAQVPGLLGMLLCSVTDHVQTVTPDKPHVHQAFNGFRNAGLDVRVNPSRAAVVATDPGLAGRTDLPDLSTNQEPDWSSPSTYAYPDSLEQVYEAAAVFEMADLVRATAPTEAEVTVVAPNGGERYRRGDLMPITWEASGPITSQDLLLSTDGGVTFPVVIATELDPAVRSYEWTVPADATRSRHCRVMVVANTGTGASARDTSDGDFRIRRKKAA